MLQDLWIPVDNVVPGDHVVIEGVFCKVIESAPSCMMWCIRYFDPRLPKPHARDWNGEKYFTLPSNREYPSIRVRPCGPSGKCEET